MRALHRQGSEGTIFAAGDCATVQLKTAAPHAERMLPDADAKLDAPALRALLQRFAAETDARSHQSAAAREFSRVAREQGLSKAFKLRDVPFGDGMMRLDDES